MDCIHNGMQSALMSQLETFLSCLCVGEKFTELLWCDDKKMKCYIEKAKKDMLNGYGNRNVYYLFKRSK